MRHFSLRFGADCRWWWWSKGSKDEEKWLHVWGQIFIICVANHSFLDVFGPQQSTCACIMEISAVNRVLKMLMMINWRDLISRWKFLNYLSHKLQFLNALCHPRIIHNFRPSLTEFFTHLIRDQRNRIREASSQSQLSWLHYSLHLRHSNSKQGKPILFLYFNGFAPSHFHTHSFNHAFIMHSAIVGKFPLIFFFNNFLVAFSCSCFLENLYRTATTITTTS